MGHLASRYRRSKRRLSKQLSYVLRVSSGSIMLDMEPSDRDSHHEPNLLRKTGARRQHKVPKVLLETFAVDDLIQGFSLETYRTFRSSLDNVAVEKRFYDVGPRSEAFSLEPWLADIDGQATPIVRRLVADPQSISGLSSDDENTFARFLAAQDFRGIHVREEGLRIRRQMADHAKAIVQHMLREKSRAKDAELVWNTVFADEPDEYWLGEERPVQPVETAAYMLDKIQGFANVLLAMPWRIASAVAGVQLYTSDEPLTRIPVPTARWAVYFEHICYLPLSPSTMLIIGPGAEPTGRGRRLRTNLSSWHAVFANYMATLHATEFLYGPEPYIDRQGRVFRHRQEH